MTAPPPRQEDPRGPRHQGEGERGRQKLQQQRFEQVHGARENTSVGLPRSGGKVPQVGGRQNGPRSTDVPDTSNETLAVINLGWGTPVFSYIFKTSLKCL